MSVIVITECTSFCSISVEGH